MRDNEQEPLTKGFCLFSEHEMNFKYKKSSLYYEVKSASFRRFYVYVKVIDLVLSLLSHINRSSLRRQGSRKVDQPVIATSLKVILFKLSGLDIVQSAVNLHGRGNIANFSYRKAFTVKRLLTESGMTPFPGGARMLIHDL